MKIIFFVFLAISIPLFGNTYKYQTKPKNDIIVVDSLPLALLPKEVHTNEVLIKDRGEGIVTVYLREENVFIYVHLNVQVDTCLFNKRKL